MVTRDIFTHDVSFHCCQGQGYHNIYAELNSTCAEVTSIRKQDSRIYFCNLGMAIQLKKDSHLGGNLVQLVIILVTKKN